MDLETPVSPGEETQNLTPEPAQELPEVAAPETAEPEAQADAEQPEADDREKALKRMERRIQRLTAARYEAEARAKAAAEEAARFRQQFEQPQEQEQPKVDPIALAEVIARHREVTNKANQIAQQGAAKFPDFGDAVKAVNDEAGPLFTSQGLPTPLGEAILDADSPAELLHYLGKNPDVAAELHGLTPIQQARRIARIEAQMSAPQQPKVSNAPKAIKPLNASRPSAGEPSPDMPIDEWMRLRNEQLAKRPRF